MSPAVPQDDVLDMEILNKDPIQPRKTSLEVFWSERNTSDSKGKPKEQKMPSVEKPRQLEPEPKKPSETDVHIAETLAFLSLVNDRERQGLAHTNPFMGDVVPLNKNEKMQGQPMLWKGEEGDKNKNKNEKKGRTPLPTSAPAYEDICSWNEDWTAKKHS